MSTIRITCECGAEFEAEGTDSHCAFRSGEFLEAHKGCRGPKAIINYSPSPYQIDFTGTPWYPGLFNA